MSKMEQYIKKVEEFYESPKVGYAERKWHHEKILEELFSGEELRKMHMIDCYKMIEGKNSIKIVLQWMWLEVVIFICIQLKKANIAK